MDHLDLVECTQRVTRRLPHCEHSTQMNCSQDPSTVQCKELCGGTTQCCSKRCKSQCSKCQKVTLTASGNTEQFGIIRRFQHAAHPCERLLYCQHLCGSACSQDHHCNPTCKKACRQQCAHTICKKRCYIPCVPCMEPCQWRCAHHACPVACGSVSLSYFTENNTI